MDARIKTGSTSKAVFNTTSVCIATSFLALVFPGKLKGFSVISNKNPVLEGNVPIHRGVNTFSVSFHIVIMFVWKWLENYEKFYESLI